MIKVLRDSNAKVVYFNGKDAGGTFLVGHDDHIHVSWLVERFEAKVASLKDGVTIE